MAQASSSKNVLVTGATGFLGSRLVEHLAGFGGQYKILATGRKFSHPNKVDDKNVVYSLGDLSDKLFVKSLFENKIDIVINCASLAAPWGSRKLFEIANVNTQKNLIHSSCESSIERFVYISTPSIYFNNEDSFNITEDSPISKNRFGHYARTKFQAEQLLKESKLKHIILRPRALVGRGDTVIMPRLVRASKDGRLRIIGSGNNIVNLTSVGNMVEAIRLAMHSPYLDEDYNISNGEVVLLWDAINLILEHIGEPIVKKRIPYWLAHKIASFMELKAKISNSKQEPSLTKFGVKVLAKSLTFDISKAKNKLGYKVLQTNTEALEEFASWYKMSH